MRSVRRDRHDAVWRPVWGEYKTIRDHYNELTLDLREQVAPRRALQLVFRVFDDGVGFRYVLPSSGRWIGSRSPSEDTEFKFADDFTAWWIPAQFGPGSGDEELWRRTRAQPDGGRGDPGHDRRRRCRLRHACTRPT